MNAKSTYYCVFSLPKPIPKHFGEFSRIRFIHGESEVFSPEEGEGVSIRMGRKGKGI